MASRKFLDSDGVTWDVFDVHPGSRRRITVSEGLGKGWLAFVSMKEKRRLVEYPEDWWLMSVTDLGRLCASARVAPAPRVPVRGYTAPLRDSETAADEAASEAEEVPPAPSPDERSPMEESVRAMALRARAEGVPIVEAALRLRQLARDRGEPATPARLRQMRSWFVQAYYFG